MYRSTPTPSPSPQHTMGKINELIQELVQFTYALGFFSELIISIIVIYVLSNQIYFHALYLLGFVAGVYFNRWLKEQLHDPRPDHPIKFLAAEKFKTSKTQNFYGMPSGHSQQVAYSVAFLYACMGHWNMWLNMCVIVGVLMVLERWLFRNHTALQLFVGLWVGVAFAGFVLALGTWSPLAPVHRALDAWGEHGFF